jgi:hypothetical protein
MDDTIKDAEDLEKIFGLVPLTVIPENEQFHLHDNELEQKKHKGFLGRGRKS